MIHARTGYPNDLCHTEHGSRVKVIHPNGKVTYQEATYWQQEKVKLQKRGRKAR